MIKMLTNINETKAAVTSILSAALGTWYNYCSIYFASFTLVQANTAFQHAAWTVAILAGIVSIVNGVKNWKRKKKQE